MSHRSLTRLRVSLALSFAVLAIPSVAGALIAPPPSTHRWTFDEEDGIIAYDDAGLFDGTLGSSTTRTPGPFGTNVISIVPTDIYDTNGYVDLGDVGAFGVADFSITHWYKTSFSGPGKHGDILGNRVDGSLGNFISVRLVGSGTVSVEFAEDEEGTNSVALVGDPAFGVNDGQWHHLAYTRSGATVSLYIDGILADTRDTGSGNPTYIAGTHSFRIGRRLPTEYDDFHTIPASYEDVRIFDHALDEGEVLDILAGTL